LERAKRTGYPEAVFCAGKTIEQSLAIFDRMTLAGVPCLGTRLSPELAEAALAHFPSANYNACARAIALGKCREQNEGLVAVVCAGASDLPVAEEAAFCAEFYGSNTQLFSDVGVAGIHRLFERMDEIRKARVVVAVAGMEGALPSVLAGLVSVPVIGLPTSVGYGANFGGFSALLAMLNSCAPGVSVVNIDNGFGAGYLANQINQMRQP
jgi:NCAIR mutase (PurE)-related protein